MYVKVDNILIGRYILYYRSTTVCYEFKLCFFLPMEIQSYYLEAVRITYRFLF